MTSPNTTPFIPPLGSPNPSPGQQQAHTLPGAWGQSYFSSPYPNTPYSSSTAGFIPGTSTPPYGPPTRVRTPPRDRHGTAEYVGYPNVPPTPIVPPPLAQGQTPQLNTPGGMGPVPRPMHQSATPAWGGPNAFSGWGNDFGGTGGPGPGWTTGPAWGHHTPASAPIVPPMGTPWQGGGGGLPGGWGPQPQSAGLHGAFLGVPPPQMGWGGGGMTPGMGPAMGLGGMTPGAFGSALPTVDVQRPNRPGGGVEDKVDRFLAGSHYGPVLSAVEIQTLGIKLQLHPLLQVITSNADECLQWSMVSSPHTCHYSKDPTHVSWSKSRDEPATFPRIDHLRLVSSRFIFCLDIPARDKDVGVTCTDVIDGIHNSLMKLTSKADYDELHPLIKKRILQSYNWNRSRAPGAPGGSLGRPMRRIDFLGEMSVFGGLRETVIPESMLGVKLPCTFELVGMVNFPMTQQEAEAQRTRAAEAAEREAQERAARAHREAASTATSAAASPRLSVASEHRGRETEAERRSRRAERRARERSANRSRTRPTVAVEEVSDEDARRPG